MKKKKRPFVNVRTNVRTASAHRERNSQRSKADSAETSVLRVDSENSRATRETKKRINIRGSKFNLTRYPRSNAPDLPPKIFQRENPPLRFFPFLSASILGPPTSAVSLSATFCKLSKHADLPSPPPLSLSLFSSCVYITFSRRRQQRLWDAEVAEIWAPFVEREEQRRSTLEAPPSTTKTPSRSDTSFVPVHCPRRTRSPTRVDARVISPRRCRPLGQLVPTPRRPALPSPCIMRSLLENVSLFFFLFAVSLWLRVCVRTYVGYPPADNCAGENVLGFSGE